jgi:protein-S-isoprenylcysteine O-methyltransferase Ste14
MPERGEKVKESFLHLMQRVRVPAGLAMALLMVIAAHPTWRSIIVGGMVAATGIAIRAWASGCIKKNEELATTGPYAYTRNPLYLGTFLLGAGAAISTGSLWFIALFLALYLLIYVPVMRAEAETLRKLFPDEYEAYSRQVPWFFPRLTPYRKNLDQAGSALRANSFEFDLYLRHREYRALLGLLAVLALLAAKMYL